MKNTTNSTNLNENQPTDEATALAFELLGEDRRRVTYRPEFAKLTGSVTAAILLQQIIHWCKSSRGDFYKFAAPCSHDKYKPGDSWQEELAFSRSELTTALKKIGTKIVKGVSKSQALSVSTAEFNADGSLTKECATKLVVYWTDSDRITRYRLNVALLGNALKQHYLTKQESDITFLTKKYPEKNSKKNPHTTATPPCVDANGKKAPSRRVCEFLSKHSADVVREYVDTLEGIYNPAGLTQTLLESGASDSDVDAFLAARVAAEEAKRAYKERELSVSRGGDVVRAFADYSGDYNIVRTTSEFRLRVGNHVDDLEKYEEILRKLKKNDKSFDDTMKRYTDLHRPDLKSNPQETTTRPAKSASCTDCGDTGSFKPFNPKTKAYDLPPRLCRCAAGRSLTARTGFMTQADHNSARHGRLVL
jgi:hypothetical protein